MEGFWNNFCQVHRRGQNIMKLFKILGRARFTDELAIDLRLTLRQFPTSRLYSHEATFPTANI